MANGVSTIFSSVINTVAGIFGSYDKHKDKSAIEAVETAKRALSTGGGITSIASGLIITPVLIVSNNLSREEITRHMKNKSVDIFTAFYAQAFHVLTDVYKLKGSVAIEVLSTNEVKADTMGNAINLYNRFMAKEDLDMVDLMYGTEAREDISIVSRRTSNKQVNDVQGAKDSSTNLTYSNDEMSSIITKNVMITLNGGASSTNTANGKTASNAQNISVTIPITIKTRVIIANTEDIIEIVADENADTSFTNVLDRYRSGEISLASMIMGDDLVKEYKQNRIKDTSDIIKLKDKRTMNSVKKLLKTDLLGADAYYSMYILSKSDADRISAELGGKFSRPKVIERFFERTKSMLLSIVDTDREQIVLHTKDIDGYSVVDYKDIKKTSKDDSLAEIMTSLIANSGPQF